MSTRSFIAIETDTGYKAIYCHWDGYPSYNGKILAKYYQDKEKVNSLIAHGDADFIGEKIDPDPKYPHSTSLKPGEYQKDVCMFYNRDYGKELVIHYCKTIEKLFDQANNSWAEYIYIYRNQLGNDDNHKNNHWDCYEPDMEPSTEFYQMLPSILEE